MSQPLSRQLTEKQTTWYLAAAKRLLRALAAFTVDRAAPPASETPWCSSLASCLRAGQGEAEAGGSPPSGPVQPRSTLTSNPTSNPAARPSRPDSPAWGSARRHQESRS